MWVAVKSLCVSFLLHGIRYLMPRSTSREREISRAVIGTAQDVLLRVELDNQLLAERYIDLRARSWWVHQEPLTSPDHLQPGGNRPVPRGLPEIWNGTEFTDVSRTS